MQKMDFLLKLTPCEEVKNDVLPMFYRALESDAQQIQELCLTVLPTFAGQIEYPAMKNALLPRIKRLCISTSYISVSKYYFIFIVKSDDCKKRLRDIIPLSYCCVGPAAAWN